MEYDEQDQNEDGGILSRLRESPRTVSVLIIILIVAAAIYAFSGNQDVEQNIEEVSEELSDEAMMMEEAADEGGTSEEMMEEVMVEAPEAVSPEVLAAQNEALPTGERTSEGYVETAQAGDGITHLARRAATRYLAEQEVDYEVTNEHRIYIEDYIKDNIGTQGLALNEQVTVSVDLMQEAVAAAGELTPQQLKNLSKYTYVLQ